MTSASLFVLGSFVAACCASVTMFPTPGESVAAKNFTVETGGKGLNVAIGARRLGCPVHCLIAVGDDIFGAMAEPTLVRNGISPALILRFAETTGAGIGFIQDHGENCVAVFPGANLCLSAADVRAVATLVESAALVVGQYEIPDSPIVAAFALARAAGRQTLLNPSPFRPIPPDLLADTTIMVVNECEALALAASCGFRISVEDAREGRFETLAFHLHRNGPDALVVTRGSKGALAFRRGGEVLRQPGFLVDAIDTLGSGDAFTAALAAALVEDLSFAHALKRAAANGALMASRRGTIGALPSRAELDRFAFAQG